MRFVNRLAMAFFSVCALGATGCLSINGNLTDSWYTGVTAGLAGGLGALGTGLGTAAVQIILGALGVSAG